MERRDNLGGGGWVRGNDYSPKRNPSNPGDTIAEYARGDVAQVVAAVDATTAAFPVWSWKSRNR